MPMQPAPEPEDLSGAISPAEIHASVDSSETKNDNDLPEENDRKILPVVGLGGSAGSIGALQTFFEGIPEDLGIGYVVVIHLSPEHESQLADILRRKTRMEVVQVRETVKIRPDTVYVIPPGYHLTMSNGHIELAYPEQERGKRVAVDLFFRSLAATHRSRAVAVVLSGVDGDGAIGIKRIKESGGLTIAQDPEEAEHQGMPRSAIDTGMVDWILSVQGMPAKLTEWIRNERRIHLPPSDEANPSSPEDGDEAALREILGFVQSRTGHDFSHYKRATILRRIQRRLQVNSLEDLPHYAAFLRSHPGEAVALLQDLLISVTNFFRDPESFQALSEELPALFARKKPGDPIRVWVPGCATGEEPYSLMMLLLEQADVLEVRPVIQIFATDLDGQALRVAREACYPLTISADVSPERLKRFFIVDQGRYRLKKEVKERVLFAPHNVLSDAPFSRLDLISCRNLLIYFNREAQEHVMNVFHFSLLSGGRMFLGSSETMDGGALFLPRDKKHRVFERSDVPRPAVAIPISSVPRIPLSGYPDILAGHHNLPAPVLPVEPESERTAVARMHHLLIRQAAPPSVLVNANYEIVHLSPGAGRFLRFAEGKVSMDLISVIHPSLRPELRTALFRATESREDVDASGVLVETGGTGISVGLRIRHPRNNGSVAELNAHMLVMFVEDEAQGAIQLPHTEPNELARHLEEEIQQLRGQQAVLNDDLGTSIEELRASNEELQAMNEEHRSAVEELETSQEELQATNEELITVNQELKSKLDELAYANSDLQNFVSSSDVATVFLSRDLLIKRFTPRTTEIFRIIPGDVGRALSDLRHVLAGSDFIQDVREVIRSLMPVEREIPSLEGKWYLLRISPYRMTESEVDGVVLTFVDITPMKIAAAALSRSEERYRAIISQMGVGIIHLDLLGKIIYANRRFREMMGYEEGDVLGDNPDFNDITDSNSGMDVFPQLTAEEATELEKQLLRKDGSLIWANISISPIRDEEGVVLSAAAVVVDITVRRQAEEDLRMVKDKLTADLAGMTRLHKLNELLLNSDGLQSTLSHILSLAVEFTEMDCGVIQLVEEGSERLRIAVHQGLSEDFVEHFKYGSCEAVSLQPFHDRARVLVENVSDDPKLRGTMNLGVILSEGIQSFQATPLVSHSGTVVGMLTTAGTRIGRPSGDALQRLDLLAWMAGDFIQRTRAEEQLKRSEARFSAIFTEAEAGLSEISIDGRFRRVNETLSRILGRGKEDLMTLGVVDVTAPEDLANTMDALRQLRETGRPVSIDKRYLRPDGSRVWANSTISLLELDSNQAPMILAVTVDLTERKRTEAALRDSREHLQRVMESVRDYAIVTMDADGFISGWNSGASAMFGFSEEEAIGQSCAIIFTLEDRADGIPGKEMEIARRAGHANDERWHLRKNGHRFWVSGVMSPLFESGLVTGYVKVARDLTEQRLAEAALKESEARFRTLTSAVHQVVWTNNPQGSADYFNQRWYDYSGLTYEESVGLGWQAIVHPDDAEASTECWHHALAQKKIFDAEFRLRRADGEYRWFIGRNIPLAEADGKVIGWFGTATDIENMKRAEEALRQSEERLRIALESAEMGAWDWDIQADEVTWNDRHFYLLGLEPDGGTKSSVYFLEFVHRDDLQMISGNLMDAVERLDAFQAEFRIVRADNDAVRWMSGYGRVVESNDGKARRMVGVMYDSTPRKVIEEELRHAHDELETRVNERTRELSEAFERLREEISGRQELEEARRELLRRLVTTQEEERRRISRELHDNLGQHMVAVKLGLDSLEISGGLGTGTPVAKGFEQLREVVDLLIKATHRQAWELRPAELDHLGLEAALEHYLNDWSSRTGIDVNFRSDAECRLAPEVEIEFYRIVQESLTNVIRHACASEVEVTLETIPFAKLTVRDNGRGFDPSITTGRLGVLGMRERLFSIHGKLEIESTPGHGTKLIATVGAPDPGRAWGKAARN